MNDFHDYERKGGCVFEFQKNSRTLEDIPIDNHAFFLANVWVYLYNMLIFLNCAAYKVSRVFLLSDASGRPRYAKRSFRHCGDEKDAIRLGGGIFCSKHIR